jgi:hypothetical protein
MVIPLAMIWLCGFTPFTRVTNVCPKCPAEKTDVIVLSNGFRVAGAVVAQNNDYYVVDRYGEYRAVTKSEAASVEWKDKGGPSNLGTGDQILLKNGVVLHGAITKQVPGRYFVIQVGALSHTVWHSQIQSVHKAGSPISFQAP